MAIRAYLWDAQTVNTNCPVAVIYNYRYKLRKMARDARKRNLLFNLKLFVVKTEICVIFLLGGPYSEKL